MNVKHLITKKVQSGMRRLFFQVHNSHDIKRSGEVQVDLLTKLGVKIDTVVATVTGIDPKKYQVFYVDVPTVVEKAWGKFDWKFHSRSGRNRKVDKFEDLTIQ